MDKSESRYFNTAIKMDKALIALLEKKDFAYITVKELCAEAGVNRSTFYLHYETLADLLDETMQYLIDNFLSYFSFSEETITNQFQNKELHELIFLTEKYVDPYLEYIRDNRKVFRVALQNATHLGYNQVFDRMCIHIFNPILSRFGFSEDEQKFIMPFYMNGIHAIVMEWINEDCSTPLTTIRRIIIKCAMGNHKTQ